MFRGKQESALDEKGRVPFPAKFREKLAASGQGTLVLTVFSAPCIQAWPLKAWEELEGKLLQLPPFDPEAQQLSRLLSGDCAEVELDKQGRILIPQHLRGLVGIGKDVVFAGLIGRVEIWDPAAWSRNQAENLVNSALLERAKSIK